ncbi:hypothetical protein [Nakamurella endophytica]|uniref:Glycosyl hydrolase family 5 n=1 Tax=Nakamurella endophytica TaxID=1748367 RepID=A0A917WJQ3_9ACTN|nr:hypothetical protein [Nakamurella endophytica]GGM09019.1 hypothetical protein GCM10011594_31160 [Nakamurella endophytica]
MIRRSTAKRLVAQVLVLLGVVVALAAVVGAAQLVLRLSTGASTASALHEVDTVPADADLLVHWAPDAWQRDRRPEPATRTLVAAAYVRAWAAVGHYQTTGDGQALQDTFSGAARAAALALPRSGVATWDVGHRLRLEFYALDGATVAFRDEAADVVRSVPGAGVLLSRESYDVVMVLEDGYWRVRQLRRDGDAGTVTVAGGGAPAVDGATPVPAARLADGTATEFRPADWAHLDRAGCAAELDRARALGLTAIRVPLPFAGLGGGRPPAAALDAVRTVLGLAADRGLSVELVLFDGLTDLSPATWAAADAQLRALVAAVAQRPPALWDLADRPDDRVSATAGPAEVRAFAVHVAGTLRDADPAAVSTVTWADPATAADPSLAAVVGAVSVAVPPGADAAAVVATVRAGIGDRPLLLVLPGPATDGGWGPVPRTPARQAHDLASDLLAAHQAGVGSVSVAALADSPATGQRGLLRADGTAKPAAALVAAGAALAAVPAPGVLDLVSGRFWWAVAAALVVAAAGIWWWRRRRAPVGRRAGPADGGGPAGPSPDRTPGRTPAGIPPGGERGGRHRAAPRAGH